MSRKGGYKILNLEQYDFDLGVAKQIIGMHDYIATIQDKVTLISGLTLDDEVLDDMFIAWSVNESFAFQATIGDKTITVNDSDEVTITSGIVGGGGGGASTAEDVSYDNLTSGLEADNVQEAIDEVVDKVEHLYADQVMFSNSSSGLEADNVQDAIDELAGDIGSVAPITLTATLRSDPTSNPTVGTNYSSVNLSNVQTSKSLPSGSCVCHVDLKYSNTHYYGTVTLRQSTQSGYESRYVGVVDLCDGNYSFGSGVLNCVILIDPTYPSVKCKWTPYQNAT